MSQSQSSKIVIKGARTNNLKNISLSIPHHKFIVVTGISGSGKSSLIFDILAKEGQRRYFETMPSFTRQFLGKLNRPDVDTIEGLSPVITVGQSTSGIHSKSTVGTLSDIYDLLRLLFARTGETHDSIELSRALFSFNSEIGRCPQCNGIGKLEKIDLNKLITSPEKTIREGALAPTLPTGYIMYSQVTIDVLNTVCEAEGFNVDIPWNALSQQQQNVILNGSEKIKVPFGKHSLESRLKWTGIKAKPREEGYYKGMLPIMSDILRRDRNANILKYVHAVDCSACNGSRLNKTALNVKVKGKSIAEIGTYELSEIKKWIKNEQWDKVGSEITQRIAQHINLLEDIGLGHLVLSRPSSSLSSGEIQRIRLANQIATPLSNVLYIFDEPSIGLHQDESQKLIHHFKALVNNGNTVIVVEHNLQTIAQADHIIDIGPEAGINGGKLLFNGTLSDFLKQKNLSDSSHTFKALQEPQLTASKPANKSSQNYIQLNGCYERNLKHIDVQFQIGKLNVVSGKSGVGKSSLIRETLIKSVQSTLGEKVDSTLKIKSSKHLESFDKLIFIDHSPIGKTPRSNPATYMGLSNHIRDLYAATSEAKAKKYTKSRFSFNNKGGRCETCEGAGKTQIGMHFLGNVDLICEACNGDRFNQDTLNIKYNGLSIAEVYQLSVNEALSFFQDQKKIISGLNILQDIGLGYLTLGQSSTTLSGGEAQRIKIANQLQKKDTGSTLYVIHEPSIGLHHQNIRSLLKLFETIKGKGNTIVCIEQNEQIIQSSDWHIELGPQSGKYGGELIYQGEPKVLKSNISNNSDSSQKTKFTNEIALKGVSTHLLKNIDVKIPKNQLTVVTGVSGSGKSSLVYDTLFAEANTRFTESLSTYNRGFIQQNSHAVITHHSGLGPAIGINRKNVAHSKRSTVGTLSGIYDPLRLLYSRLSQLEGKQYTAQHYSFNHHLGACEACEGLGMQLQCAPDKIIVNPKVSIYEGAISTNKAIKYYSNPNGQFMATLETIAQHYSWDLTTSWEKLSDTVQKTILYGTGNTEWDVTWSFNTKTRSGTQSLKTKWQGFCNYIDDEYQRKINNKKIQDLEDLLHEIQCPTCNGSRLKKELLETTFLGHNIYELANLSIRSLLQLLEAESIQENSTIKALGDTVIPSIVSTIRTITDLGLGYLSLNRSTSTLSGGERQRLTLSGQLSSHLFGVTYVLDEPTIGLDSKQVKVLINALNKIVKAGNTVVVIEHDPEFIRSANYLIEMGPAAGNQGGHVIFQGSPSTINTVPTSVTYQLLFSTSKLPELSDLAPGEPFGIKEAFANNLKHIDVQFDSGCITAITGVSGSGKSSLLKDVIYASWDKNRTIGCKSTFGFKQFENVLLIDQSPLNQKTLSTPASYTGIIENLKNLFSKTDSAKQLGLKKTDFSYLSKKGKCPTCSGHGKLKTSMDFMSDIWLTCDTCKGQRYDKTILGCKYKGLSIGDVLQMTIQEAMNFFEATDLTNALSMMDEIGIGHLQLGQSGDTLSGGESQRLKLASSLIKKTKGKTLYLLDEPSTGLHYFDILKLHNSFQKIIHEGGTIVFIEHNESLINRAHKVTQLGPESGELGGYLVE